MHNQNNKVATSMVQHYFPLISKQALIKQHNENNLQKVVGTKRWLILKNRYVLK